MRQILIVDDDQQTCDLLRQYLELHQFEVVAVHDGKSFLAEFKRRADQLSLVILDVQLPDTDGFALCKSVRQHSNVPIIMLTGSSEENDRVVGLELGADDYVPKPYNPRELLARIKAIYRRAGIESADTPRYCRFAGFTLDLAEQTLYDSAGAKLALTGLDYKLLKYFVEHPGTIIDRALLCEHTRGQDPGPLGRSLDVQISKLRQRLNADGQNSMLIKAVRNAGYVFAADVVASHD